MSGLRMSAVVVGMVVDLVASVAGGMVWGGVVGFRAASQGLPPEAVAAALQGDGAMIATFLIGLAGTFLGGHVAARMGRHAPLVQGAGLGVASLVIGALYVGFAKAPPLPVWYQVGSFLAVVPAAMLGASTVARAPRAKPALA